MLGPAWFRVGDRRVQPFAVATWANDDDCQVQSLPAILRQLRGEWPCIPFGIPMRRSGLGSEWLPESRGAPKFADVDPHGFSSNAHWQCINQVPGQITVALDYPRGHPIRRVTRTAVASAHSPVIELILRIDARSTAELPIGLHPVFRLPEIARSANLRFGGETRVWTSPVPLEPDIARLQTNVRGAQLSHIPSSGDRGVATEDLTRLPLDGLAEELILVLGHAGCATLTNTLEEFSTILRWDPELFPGCMLWLSNRGRGYYPWNHRFLGLGIEPIRSAFDLGTRISQNRRNPLWQSGIPCTYSFAAAKTLETRYSIAVAEVRM
jgi:hypothetical protein